MGLRQPTHSAGCRVLVDPVVQAPAELRSARPRTGALGTLGGHRASYLVRTDDFLLFFRICLSVPGSGDRADDHIERLRRRYTAGRQQMALVNSLYWVAPAGR